VKHKHTNGRDTGPLMMRAAALLLMLVMLSSSVVSGRYARYITTASYEDSARVAKFNIVVPETSATAELQAKLIPGESVEGLEIHNYSEVAVEFTLTVENVTDNLPLSFSVTSGESPVTPVGDSTDPATFVGTVPPSSSITDYTLKILWPKSENNIDYCGRVDLIRITLDAQQVD